MRFKIWLNGWVFIYELSGCELESQCYHTINMKTFLDPWQGSLFGPLSIIFFSILSKTMILLQKKKKILKHLTGLAFLMFMKYCFVTFKKYEEYWYVIPYEVATDAKNFLLVIVYQKNTSCFLQPFSWTLNSEVSWNNFLYLRT